MLKFADVLDVTRSERLTSNRQLLCKLKGERAFVEWVFNWTEPRSPGIRRRVVTAAAKLKGLLNGFDKFTTKNSV